MDTTQCQKTGREARVTGTETPWQHVYVMYVYPKLLKDCAPCTPGFLVVATIDGKKNSKNYQMVWQVFTQCAYFLHRYISFHKVRGKCKIVFLKYGPLKQLKYLLYQFWKPDIKMVQDSYCQKPNLKKVKGTSQIKGLDEEETDLQ